MNIKTIFLYILVLFAPLAYAEDASFYMNSLPPVYQNIARQASGHTFKDVALLRDRFEVASRHGEHGSSAIMMSLTADNDVWGYEDYMATPKQLVQKGIGDCDDFSAIFFVMLKAAEYTDVELVWVRMVVPGGGTLSHMVTTVNIADVRYVLDSVTPDVLPLSKRPGLSVIFSLGYSGKEATFFDQQHWKLVDYAGSKPLTRAKQSAQIFFDFMGRLKAGK